MLTTDVRECCSVIRGRYLNQLFWLLHLRIWLNVDGLVMIQINNLLRLVQMLFISNEVNFTSHIRMQIDSLREVYIEIAGWNSLRGLLARVKLQMRTWRLANINVLIGSRHGVVVASIPWNINTQAALWLTPGMYSFVESVHFLIHASQHIGMCRIYIFIAV